MRAFKNKWFARYASKKDIQDKELLEMMKQLEDEQAGANLGGGVYKVRVAKPGEGKSGGHRVVVFFKRGERTFYVYGFEKSNRDNINDKELKVYKEAAKEYFLMTPEQLEKRIKNGQLIELKGD